VLGIRHVARLVPGLEKRFEPLSLRAARLRDSVSASPVGGRFRARRPPPAPGRLSDLRFSPGAVLHTYWGHGLARKAGDPPVLAESGSRLPCPSPGDAASSSPRRRLSRLAGTGKGRVNSAILPPQADLAARSLDHWGRLVDNSRGSTGGPPSHGAPRPGGLGGGRHPKHDRVSRLPRPAKSVLTHCMEGSKGSARRVRRRTRQEGRGSSDVRVVGPC
jgi:hypothetical protein